MNAGINSKPRFGNACLLQATGIISTVGAQLLSSTFSARQPESGHNLAVAMLFRLLRMMEGEEDNGDDDDDDDDHHHEDRDGR